MYSEFRTSERNPPISISTTGQHETVLAFVHDPAGVIANAECRLGAKLVDIPCGSHFALASSSTTYGVDIFKPEKSVSEWPSPKRAGKWRSQKGPKKSHAIQNSPHIWVWLAEIASSAP